MVCAETTHNIGPSITVHTQLFTDAVINGK